MKDKNEKSIYNLKLHEFQNIGFGISVMRVASGWIYDCWDFEKDKFKQGIFIPFDNRLKDE